MKYSSNLDIKKKKAGWGRQKKKTCAKEMEGKEDIRRVVSSACDKVN